MTKSLCMLRSFGAMLGMGAVLLLGACADQPAEGKPSETGAAVQNRTGEGTNLQTFDVVKQGRRYRVNVFNRGNGARVIVVSARSYRGVDRSDARNAYDAAYEAGLKIDCSGSPMAVLPDTATFQEEGRRSAYTTGESAWVFQGRCG